MRLHGNEEVEIARRAAVQSTLAFAGEANARAFLDTRRNIHRKGALLLHQAGAMACLAGIADEAPLSVTGGAGAFDGEEALACAHFADAGAGRALLRLGAGFRAASMAGFAGHRARHGDLRLSPAEGFFQRDLG